MSLLAFFDTNYVPKLLNTYYMLAGNGVFLPVFHGYYLPSGHIRELPTFYHSWLSAHYFERAVRLYGKGYCQLAVMSCCLSTWFRDFFHNGALDMSKLPTKGSSKIPPRIQWRHSNLIEKPFQSMSFSPHGW